jgi:2-hydroxychromene-2-carboxylate isomerase
VTAAATFYYDLSSPYAWLAAERVDALAGGEVTWVPVLLGAIFKATGRSSWAQTEARADGIAEVERRAAERGLPAVRWPEPWPGNGLAAMRAAVHAQAVGRGRRFALEAFRVHFGDGLPLSDRDALALSAERSGLDPEAVLAATEDPEVKAALRRNTDAALEQGVFGVPTVQVGTAVFWGDDRLEEALR